MLYPSIDVLLDKVQSKYTLVSIASKRAREMQQSHDAKLDKTVSYKCVGKALEEINADVLHFKIKTNSKAEEPTTD